MNHFLIFLLLIASINCDAQISKEEHIKIVEQFKAWVASDDIETLSSNVAYPLRRQYPLPDIKNASEFCKAYSNIFDANIKKTISNSDTKKDWSAVGWRGIMLHNGTLWLDYDGSFLALHYQSAYEKLERERLILKDRNQIHLSLQKFKEPILIMHTKGFVVRIDLLENDEYRYASWRANKSQRQKPDLIISKGTMTHLGSGGNHTYQFENGDHLYVCDIIYMGTDNSPPARLLVYERKHRILSQDALLLED